MKYLKIIATCVAINLSIVNSYSQSSSPDDIASLSTSIFEWLEKFDNQIDTFFTKERAHQANRKLGYLKNDLQDYLKIRKTLMDYLNSNNYNVTEAKTQQTVVQLRRKLEKLKQRLNEVTPYLNNELDKEANNQTDQIYHGQQKQSERYLGELEKLIRGQSVNEQRLKLDGETIYDELLESIGIISMIQSKLQIKFNF